MIDMKYLYKYSQCLNMAQHTNCIYCYINRVNGKIYIGQTIDFKNRHRTHVQQSSSKYPIDQAFNKYGSENFDAYILAENVPTIDELNKIEMEYIQSLNTLIQNGKGYNMRNGGNNSTLSEISKAKLSASKKGRTLTEEHKAKISKATKGEKNPMYGTVGELSPNYGRKHKEETKQKIREANLGKVVTDKTRQKLSESRMGKYKGGDNPSARAVKCVETLQCFDTVKEASEWCGTSISGIIQSIKKGYAGGRHPITNEKLHWEYIN